MAKIDIPYLQLRNGRPRWEPGPTLRHLGFKGTDLKDQAGAWLSLEEAMLKASELNAEATALRLGGNRVRRKPPASTARSCRALIEQWQRSVEWSRLAPATQSDYSSKSSVWLSEFADAAVASIDSPTLYGYWEEAYRVRGHAMANGIIAVVRAGFSHAEKIGWRPKGSNPASKLGLPGVAPRVVLWLPAEIASFVEIGDALGLARAVDAFVIGLHTGLRQHDILSLPLRLISEARLKVTPNKTKRKTAAKIDVLIPPQVRRRLDGIKQRLGDAGVIDLTQPLLTLPDGGKMDRYSLNKSFLQIREHVARLHPEAEKKEFRDLRDTAVTRLAEAECTLPFIASVTGHSPEWITRVIKHYLQLSPAMADGAMTKLGLWLDHHGIAI
jgi:hypothetical protein